MEEIKKVSWNTQRAFEDFENELYETEKLFRLVYNNSNFDNEDINVKKEFDVLWKKYDELKQSLKDEFRVIL